MFPIFSYIQLCTESKTNRFDLSLYQRSRLPSASQRSSPSPRSVLRAKRPACSGRSKAQGPSGVHLPIDSEHGVSASLWVGTISIGSFHIPDAPNSSWSLKTLRELRRVRPLLRRVHERLGCSFEPESFLL